MIIKTLEADVHAMEDETENTPDLILCWLISLLSIMICKICKM